MRKILASRFAVPFITFLLALLGGAVLALFAKENPFRVYSIILNGSFGSLEGFGYTLFYATPFLFGGLAVAIPYRVGLFNIGGEGQLYMGAVLMSAVAFQIPALGVMTPVALITAAFLGGALWAGLAGLFKAWRGSHEVITTIMLNFIAMSIANYAVLYIWKDPENPRPETLLFSEDSWMSSLHLGGSPANVSIFLGILLAIFSWILLEKTRLGFKWRAVGANPEAAKAAGFSVKAALIFSMMMGGACAGGVAVNEILGNSHRFRDGFSQGYGFIGIAVAFLGRGHPIGIIFSALFFGALFRGAGELDIETDTMTRDFAVVMQAIFIAAVAAEPWLSKKLAPFKAKWVKK